MTFGKDFFQQRATCLLLFQFCKKTWMLMQSGASDNGIVLFLCAIAYHIRGNDLVREEPSLPDHRPLRRNLLFYLRSETPVSTHLGVGPE